MQVNSLKELEKILKLCRKNGVQVMKVDGVEFVLGEVTDKPRKRYIDTREVTSQIDLNAFPEADLKIPAFSPPPPVADQVDMPDELTDEQKLFYSSVGHAEAQ
jgi:hypothetical protein